jgi:thiamine-phosphate pyrophosphorylase
VSAIARILDANLNRAGEALRVMEDAARFALNDQPLCTQLKVLRHELRSIIEQLSKPAGWLQANRNTDEDVGTSVSTSREMNRTGLLDVVIAAGKRLTESLRVIEEMAKTIDSSTAARIEAIRYSAYAIDGRLQLRFGSGRQRQWMICVILTQALCKRPWGEVLRAAIDNGADCIQIREKSMDGGDLARLTENAISIARPAGASVIVNDRVDVAMAVGADGVHIGQADLSVHQARQIAGRSLLVGVSAHDMEEAEQAVVAGADYCGVGTMFRSSVKSDYTVSGPDFLRTFIDRFTGTPHLAIGGIAPNNVKELLEAGVRGVAVCSVVCASDQPGRIVQGLKQALSTRSVSVDDNQNRVSSSFDNGETHFAACRTAST